MKDNKSISYLILQSCTKPREKVSLGLPIPQTMRPHKGYGYIIILSSESQSHPSHKNTLFSVSGCTLGAYSLSPGLVTLASSKTRAILVAKTTAAVKSNVSIDRKNHNSGEKPLYFLCNRYRQCYREQAIKTKKASESHYICRQ